MSPHSALLWLQAGAEPKSAPSLLLQSPLLLLGSLFLIWYLLLIRPQQKKQREHGEMLKGIERGDNVVTAGGLHGRVTGVTDDVLTVEIAAVKGDRVRVKVSRSRVEEVDKARKGEKEES